MERSELLSIIEQAARYGWDHPSWDWPSVNGDLARFLPPPPAEQASGEHVEALTKLREREWETADAFGRLDAKWFSRQEAAFDAAIAALSQRPVVDEAMVERASAEYEREAIAGSTHEKAWRAALIAALAPQQPEKGEG